MEAYGEGSCSGIKQPRQEHATKVSKEGGKKLSKPHVNTGSLLRSRSQVKELGFPRVSKHRSVMVKICLEHKDQGFFSDCPNCYVIGEGHFTKRFVSKDERKRLRRASRVKR